MEDLIRSVSYCDTVTTVSCYCYSTAVTRSVCCDDCWSECKYCRDSDWLSNYQVVTLLACNALQLHWVVPVLHAVQAGVRPGVGRALPCPDPLPDLGDQPVLLTILLHGQSSPQSAPADSSALTEPRPGPDWENCRHHRCLQTGHSQGHRHSQTRGGRGGGNGRMQIYW